MAYKKILTIQDISCVGQCSLTVALPVISACGIETCVLPSAVLSNHTTGFGGYTFRDLTEDMPGIVERWRKEGIAFEAIYTGYLASVKQIGYVADIFERVAAEKCVKIVDPAMADNGSLYPGFDAGFVEAMKGLCSKADYVLPNITEACLLTGMPYKGEYAPAYIGELLEKLLSLGSRNAILTGVSYAPGKTGVAIAENGRYSYYEHHKMPKSCPGTGDVFASAFVGALVRGKSAYDAARIAADYTLECIRLTAQDSDHWYGVKFEPVLWKLIRALGE